MMIKVEITAAKIRNLSFIPQWKQKNNSAIAVFYRNLVTFATDYKP